ncbi:MAG: hypothetical protein DDT18_01809 [Actinobacteria bacterium]|nr:hypothetical protein [Actinomycetota bacterium]
MEVKGACFWPDALEFFSTRIIEIELLLCVIYIAKNHLVSAFIPLKRPYISAKGRMFYFRHAIACEIVEYRSVPIAYSCERKDRLWLGGRENKRCDSRKAS